VGAGETVGPLTFANPRQHVVIVLVCHESINTLAPSDVVQLAGPSTQRAVGAA
jgi:hypothetical protein